jgi:hypothetical protein
MRRRRVHDRAVDRAGHSRNGEFTPLQQLIPHDYLATLAPEERNAFFAYHGEGRSKEEIAADMGRPVSWVNKTLHVCYKKLRDLADPAGKVYREVSTIRTLLVKRAKLLARSKSWDPSLAESCLQRIRTTEFPDGAAELIRATCADLRQVRQALEQNAWPALRILETLASVCAHLPERPPGSPTRPSV